MEIKARDKDNDHRCVVASLRSSAQWPSRLDHWHRRGRSVLLRNALAILPLPGCVLPKVVGREYPELSLAHLHRLVVDGADGQELLAVPCLAGLPVSIGMPIWLKAISHNLRSAGLKSSR